MLTLFEELCTTYVSVQRLDGDGGYSEKELASASLAQILSRSILSFTI